MSTPRRSWTGLSPFDTVVDAPVSYHTSSGIWAPHNYDDKFEGTITVLHALAESRNVPAVRTLARIGVDKVIKLCRKFGLTSRLVPNLPLALGASDLTLLEHTSAFTTFPNDGVHISPRMVTRVTNYDGRLIDDFPPEVTDVDSRLDGAHHGFHVARGLQFRHRHFREEPSPPSIRWRGRPEPPTILPTRGSWASLLR